MSWRAIFSRIQLRQRLHARRLCGSNRSPSSRSRSARLNPEVIFINSYLTILSDDVLNIPASEQRFRRKEFRRDVDVSFQ